MGLGTLLSRRRPKNSGGGWPVDGLPQEAGLLSAEISDPMGQPLPGVEVTLTETDTRRHVLKATTDPFGRVTAALPQGRYALRGTVEGLHPLHRVIEVPAGAPAPLERLRMETGQEPDLPQPGVWVFDPPHSAIRFVARHFGMSNVHGRFTRFDGGIRVAERMEDSYLEITIDASSIDTGNRTRDEHLKSADFLDVERYPYLHFASSKLTHKGGSKWTVQGTLTLHGVSRTVNLDTSYHGSVNGGYGEELRCAAYSTAELHRDDFTLNYGNMIQRGIVVIGRTVQLEMDIQAMYRHEGMPTPPE
ncbi:YceI family protein [Streptomyces albiaxialis]|uniref:YceI family protein n=1 Tax=Streptomyces albiaxialis TaxID=329523 RepID=A0ABN2WIT7_9ACTN